MAVEDRLFRALAVLRIVTLINAVGLNIYRRDNLDHPIGAWAVVGGMVVWSAIATWAYSDALRRTWVLLFLDLAVALTAIALTPVFKGPTFNATIPGFWVMAALLAWAIRFRLWGGLVAATLIGATDLLLRDELTQTNYANVYLLFIGGPIVGYMCGSLQEMAAERDAAERSAAAAAERARLARVVHDGVLQVLALVQRRGAELGAGAAELGRLAGEQESRLRTLIRSQDAVGEDAGGTSNEVVDVASRLGRLSLRPGVDVVVPGGPVELPGAVAAELVAAVAACLDNVTVHVGEGAPAWVLLEAFPDRVEVSVRDEGPGIAPGRLEQAAADGRLGVTGSIRGRIEDLGGTAVVTSGSFGTEWELVVPRGEA